MSKITCPECIKGYPYSHAAYFRSSGAFKEHIELFHDKNLHKWFKQWSDKFFKHNPQFQIYFGVVNDKYETKQSTKPAPKPERPRKSSDWW